MSKAPPYPETIDGRYQVIQRIGSGGMGEVFRARDPVLGRTVALKLLPREVAQHAGAVDRFRTEAQAAARINHPNVVQVHDWGQTESTYYMVMEYVRGRNLREILAARGRLEPRQATDIIIQVLDALAASHSTGLVHRDIKPENVIVSIDGTVKVTDFGIARVTEASVSTDGLFGTVAYVAPEQARGEMVDGRSDVYSVGCLLYELLTGSMPFSGDAARLLYQHLNDAIPKPSLEAADVPESMDRIVEKATAKGPADRFSAAEMKAELMAVAATLPPATPLAELTYELTSEVSVQVIDTLPGVPAPKKRHVLRWATLLLLIGLAVLGFFYHPVKVPRVIGEDRTSAVAAIRRSGMAFETSRRFSDEPAGKVLSSDPSPGKWAMPWTKVSLVISAGPRLTDVPQLVGMNVDDARKKIVELKLVVGEVTEVHDKSPAGQVIDQNPKPGRVRVGDPVNLTVSSGPEFVVIPGVVGQQFADAQKKLTDMGLVVERIDEFNDAAVGQVIAQEPVQDQRVEKGSTVKLHASKGPAPFAMPDVKNKSCSEAKSQLESLGLVVVVRSKSGPCSSNKILDQDPLPGATVKKGDEATLYAA